MLAATITRVRERDQGSGLTLPYWCWNTAASHKVQYRTTLQIFLMHVLVNSLALVVRMTCDSHVPGDAGKAETVRGDICSIPHRDGSDSE